jgi:hypothetical protein
MFMRFLTQLAKAGSKKLGEVTLLVPRQLMEAPFANHIKLNTESGELGLAHCQRNVDTGGRALRSSHATVGSGLNPGHVPCTRVTKRRS